ncbi:uncharacterized protein JCM15063_005545 [Sporobolomyces koalae]|uniref:uncharacterized protein n=1 Tax=Sporobolomyces koalae TaxID=500713 RepID=UPI003175E10B
MFAESDSILFNLDTGSSLLKSRLVRRKVRESDREMAPSIANAQRMPTPPDEAPLSTQPSAANATSRIDLATDSSTRPEEATTISEYIVYRTTTGHSAIAAPGDKNENQCSLPETIQKRWEEHEMSKQHGEHRAQEEPGQS